jgi:hypothetical protein
VSAHEPWEIPPPPPPAPSGRRPRVGVAAGVVAILGGLCGLAATLYLGGFLGGAPAGAPAPAPAPTAGLGEAIRDASGLVVRVDAVRTVPVTGPSPGRVGVVLRVVFTNRGTRPLTISAARVRLAGGTPTDAGRYDGTLVDPLAPGRTDTGEYVFAVRRADLARVEVTVAPGAGHRTLVFTGRMS